MNRTVRIGSRDSTLALRQTELVRQAIQADNPDISTELVLIKTTGDLVLDTSLDEIGGKGLFIKELEAALLDNSIDIAVHSYKDMPVETSDDLQIVALSPREQPFDALVLPVGADQISPEPAVGSSSQRRAIQFADLYPECTTASIRGNVLTRLRKLDEGQYSALILAQAGLLRLGLEHRIHQVFTADAMIPAASQGIMAVQGRAGEDYGYLAAYDDQTSRIASQAERQFLITLGGDCSAPIAAYAQVSSSQLLLRAMYVDKQGRMAKGQLAGATEQAAALGEQLANQLLRSLEA